MIGRGGDRRKCGPLECLCGERFLLMKKSDVIIIIVLLVFLLTGIALFFTVPSLRLTIKHGLGTETISKTNCQDELDLYLSVHKEKLYLDGYSKTDKKWVGLSLSHAEGSEWTLYSGYFFPVKNGMIGRVNYTVIARKTPSESYSGELTADNIRIDIRTFKRKDDFYQMAVARTESWSASEMRTFEVDWKMLRDAVIRAEDISQ